MKAVPGSRISGLAKLFATTLFVATPLIAADKDWPMFRGNAAQTGVVAETLADSYTLAWTWKAGSACGSPVAAAGVAVVGAHDGKVHAIEVATGKLRWTVDLGDQIDAAPLILDSDVLIGTTGGTLVRLALTDGAKRWEYKTGDKIVGAATWFEHAGAKRVLVGSYDNLVHCLDAATGAKVWVYATDSFVNGTPGVGLLDGKLVAVAGGCDAKLHVIDLANGAKLRDVPMSAYVAASVAVDGGKAFVGHYGNEVICADLATGAVTWTYKDRSFPYFSSPAVTAEVVVLGGRDRRVHCIDRLTGKARWVFPTRGNVDGSPLIGAVAGGDGRVLIGSDDGRLYLIDLATGKERWSFEIGGQLGGAPALVGGMILVGCDDGGLYAFKPATKE